MKTIMLKILGSVQEPLDIILHPGVTAWEILDAAELKGCVLSLAGNPAQPLALEDAIYDLVKDGEALYARLPMRAEVVDYPHEHKETKV